MPPKLSPARLAASLPYVVPLVVLLDLLLLPTGFLPALSGPDGAGDFQWSGARLLAQGVDPYRAALAGEHVFIRAQSPNYLHGLYVLLLPLGVLPFAVARVLWGFLNLAMVATAAVLLGRAVGLRGWSLSGFLALVGCSMPFMIAMHAGQQSALVLLFSVLAYRARGDVARGAALAVAVTKYSFAPLAFLLVLRRRWLAAGVAAGVSVGMVGVMSVMTGTNALQLAVEPLRVGKGMSRGAADAMSLTGVLTGSPRSPLTYAAAAVTALVLAAWGRRVLSRAHWVDALACACLISLLSFPHLVYDFCLLLPVLASALRLRGRAQATLLAVVAYFWYNWLLGGFPFGPYSVWGIVTNAGLLLIGFAALTRARPDRPWSPGPDVTSATEVTASVR